MPAITLILVLFDLNLIWLVRASVLSLVGAAEWTRVGNRMPSAFGRGQKVLLCAWAGVFVMFVAFLRFTDTPPRSFDKAHELGELKLYTPVGEGYAPGQRQKAIDFSLDRLAALVNYLLLASAGVMAFAVKTVVELRAERIKVLADAKDGEGKEPHAPPRRSQLLLFLHAGIACFFSLVCGVLAYMYLAGLGTSESFNLGGHLSVCITFQAIALLSALLLLLGALAGFLRDLLHTEAS